MRAVIRITRAFGRYKVGELVWLDGQGRTLIDRMLKDKVIELLADFGGD